MDDRAKVVIVGGGVAGLEALLAIREHAGARVALTLVTPDEAFAYRPLSVGEPFGRGEPRRYPLDDVARDARATLVRGRAAAVVHGERRVVLGSGRRLPYDTLLLAPGARTLPPFDDAITFGQPGSGAAMRELLEQAAAGEVRRVAFVAPQLAGWSLPLYELALLTAATCRDRGEHEAELVLVTPEPRPLAAFGAAAGQELARMLDEAGVRFIGSAAADLDGGRLRVGHGAVDVDRVVSLPLLRGPGIEGVPGEPRFGFIPADEHGRVERLEGVYAAGDAIDVPVKQGGLAAQQAEAAAEHIAARHGAPLEPRPSRGVLRGMLLAGDERRFLRSTEEGETVADRPLWWPPTKIAGRFLAPYLAARDGEAVPGEAPSGFVDVEVRVGA
jgi:sulfide:quinone oxidoreductase